MYREQGPLTPRQREVLEMLGLGLSTREIADSLFICVKTVESHCENLKLNLGASTLRKLIVLAACRRCEQGAYEIVERAPDGTTVKYRIKKVEGQCHD
jgi:DNA-binding NarL/FixJ family response regulator